MRNGEYDDRWSDLVGQRDRHIDEKMERQTDTDRQPEGQNSYQAKNLNMNYNADRCKWIQHKKWEKSICKISMKNNNSLSVRSDYINDKNMQ